MATAKKKSPAATKRTTPATKERDDKKNQDALDVRPALDAEQALEVIEDDFEQDHSESPGWPAEFDVVMGEETYTYLTAPVDDVLGYLQITFALDSNENDKLRSFLEAILGPGEQEIFVNDMRTYLVAAKKRGEKIDADEFYKQLQANIFSKFSSFMSPKDDKRSGGPRRTGRRSKSPRKNG